MILAPPTMAASHSPVEIALQAPLKAEREDAQAVRMVTLRLPLAVTSTFLKSFRTNHTLVL